MSVTAFSDAANGLDPSQTNSQLAKASSQCDDIDLFKAYKYTKPSTAGINRSNTAVRAVLEQPCSTGGPARTGRTNLSDQLALASVGQCPSDHRSNTAVRAPLEQPCSTG
ncbi:hypothetical protein PCASD_14969 [Puccinia coronata f. sp. avenae]|uniref:Uncharacterized protein n=1 Tax=Puccinia coronata f. sp. avenae TaxID=200324 RepID=A0A2N5U7A9_9BASI|nr:hypothetical protein PCASD_14969 [Puccinia coronata f. sp. avenae]